MPGAVFRGVKVAVKFHSSHLPPGHSRGTAAKLTPSEVGVLADELTRAGRSGMGILYAHLPAGVLGQHPGQHPAPGQRAGPQASHLQPGPLRRSPLRSQQKVCLQPPLGGPAHIL